MSHDPLAPNTQMKHARCPRCGKEFTYSSVAEHKSFPFCSPRCRDIDLGNWLSGRYLIPGQEGSVDVSDEDMSPAQDAT